MTEDSLQYIKSIISEKLDDVNIEDTLKMLRSVRYWTFFSIKKAVSLL